MLEHCIRSTTFENDIVLDCFAGSGSSLIAALKTNRYSIGIEIDKNWCTAIRERLELVSDIDICQFEGYTLMKGSGKKKKEVIEAPSLF
jgi:DNA modification methylase